MPKRVCACVCEGFGLALRLWCFPRACAMSEHGLTGNRSKNRRVCVYVCIYRTMFIITFASFSFGGLSRHCCIDIALAKGWTWKELKRNLLA